MIRLEPPVAYIHWSGKKNSKTADAERLIDRWRYPFLDIDEEGTATLTIPDYQGEVWVHAGFYPRPVTRRDRWRVHWHHGRLMNIPYLSVLMFCIRDQMS